MLADHRLGRVSHSLSFITGNLDQDVSELWPRVTRPALIVWGLEATTTPIADAEDSTPIADAEDFLRARPETSFLPLQGAKLLPNEERAEAFNEAVGAFLERVEPWSEATPR